MNINLKELGWNTWFEREYFEKELKGENARIVEQHKNIYIVQNERGLFKAKLSGKLVYNNDFAVVGDWVNTEGNIQDDFLIINHIY